MSLNAEEKNDFLFNLAMLLESGTAIAPSLASLANEARAKGTKHFIKKLGDDVESGIPLSRAFTGTGALTKESVAIIRIGEENGRLAENLKMLATQGKKEAAITAKFRGAMLYPVFVLGVTAVVGVGVAWFTLPRLATVFSQLNLTLPLITKVLIAAGNFLGQHGWAVPVGFAILPILFLVLKKTGIAQYLLFMIPGLRRITLETEIARFGYTVGSLLHAGLPLPDALEAAAGVTSFGKYKKLYLAMKGMIEDGASFKKIFEQPGIEVLVPQSVEQMIAAGEESGHLAEVMQTIGANFEEKVDATTKDLSIIIEPVLLVIVWIGVVTVALAVILPIYSLIGGLQGK